MQKRGTLTDRSLKLISMLLTVALLVLVAPHSFASNFLLSARSDEISTAVASAKANHNFSFTLTQTSTPVGSIRFMFCSNSPIIGDPCTAPSGFDASGAQLVSQQGETGFVISPLSDASTIIVTRPASLPTGNPSDYEFANITNPSAAGSYYVRVETFTSTDATGANVEQGGVVFAIVSALNLTAIVPPYLKFCSAVTITNYDCSTANSYFIDMGDFSTSQTSRASSEFVVATNAGSGFTVTLSGTTLTSGNNIIPALTPGSTSKTGVSQFGLNLRANTSPGIGADPTGPGAAAVTSLYNTPNIFRFQPGDAVVSGNFTTDNKKFTVSYITNVDGAQPAGYYSSTITYICLANF